jgi:hypothetical protein
MQFLEGLDHLIDLPINRICQPRHPVVLIIQIDLMFDDFAVYFLVEPAIVEEDCIQFLEFLHDEVALVDHRLDGDAAAHEHLVDGHELGKLLVINHVLEALNLVL